MPSSSTAIRYAIVGLGHIAQAAVLPAFAHARRSRLAALISGDARKRAQLSGKYKVPAFSYEQYEDCLAQVRADDRAAHLRYSCAKRSTITCAEFPPSSVALSTHWKHNGDDFALVAAVDAEIA